ncbi:MAG TPA: DUF4012 domain-containing protein [Anaerolineae bacterium]|nr:DUF4012 domain-containing protein [Anaerolineae bacterium]
MSAEETALTESNTKSVPWIKYLLLGAAALFLLWAGLKVWRIGSAAYSLWQLQAEARALAEGGLTGIDPDQAEEMVRTARQDVATLRKETAVFMPLTPYFGWIPKMGPLIVAAPHLMEMADAGTETAAYAMRGLKPGLAALQSESETGESKLPQLVAAIDQARPDLLQAAQSLDKVAAARSQIDDVNQFPSSVQELMTLFDEMLPLAQDGLKLAQVLPQMAGVDGPRRYLILAQNEDELRATGGFISGTGVVVVENGRILSLDFGDAYGVDDLAGKPYEEYPPQPLYELMQLDYFLFRDANYWPDFPTSAEKAMSLYEYGQDYPPLDGVIAIDQHFLELLLGGLGPIAIPELELEVSAETLLDDLRASWRKGADDNQAWWATRKAFLGPFAAAIMQKLESGDLSDVKPKVLLLNMSQAVHGKHLQIYMRDPVEAAVLDEIDWDGRLENNAGQDFLLALDMNMGFNKANVYVEREIDYAVDLLADDTAVANLTIKYTHTGADTGQPCTQYSPYQDITNYLQVANKCYFNYLRVYTPQQAHLLDSSEHFVPAAALMNKTNWQSTATESPEFADFMTFANFFYLPQGQQARVSLQYQIPDAVVTQGNQRQYTLTIPKQASVQSQPLSVNVALPDGAQLDEVTFQPGVLYDTAVLTENTIQFTTQQTTDIVIKITYTLPN